MAVSIRLLQHGDTHDVAANCFPEVSADEIAERVRDDLSLQQSGQGVTLVAEEGGRVGVFAKLLKHERAGWVFNVAAHPDFRGRGIIQALLDALADRAREMGLDRLAVHVREDNVRARKAYEKAGFRHVGQDGMHGAQLRYERRLPPPVNPPRRSSPHAAPAESSPDNPGR